MHSPQALVADYEQHAAGEFQQLIGRTLRLTMGICARDERQLIPQLVGRLMAVASPERSHFIDCARLQLERPALAPYCAGLTPPGAETARLEGHEGSVRALCVLPDGRLASASGDKTARLEVDASVLCLATILTKKLVAGDVLGRLHWLEIVD